MPAIKTQLIGGTFQDSEGNALANGTLTFHLSQDCLVSGVGSVCSGIDVIIQLDSMGNVASSTSTPAAPDQYIWSNLAMTPQNNYYRVTGKTFQGQIAWGPNNQQIPVSATFNLDSWVPNTVISWFPTLQTGLAVEVAGVPFSSSSLLNFESSDSTVTITDLGGGLLNFQVAASGNNFDTPGYGGFWGCGFPEEVIFIANNNVSGPSTPGNPTLWQFVLESTWTVGTIGFYAVSAFGGTYGDMGIYNDVGDLLLHSGPQDMSVTGTVQASITPVTLQGGSVYYLASGYSYSGCLIAGFGGGTYQTRLAVVMNASSNPIKCAYGSTALGANGALPPNFGTLVDSTGNLPAIPAAFFGV
jgi:hypothetical protein